MNYSTMFNWVFDALNNGSQLVVANEWLSMFRKVCFDYNIDYVAEIHKGYYFDELRWFAYLDDKNSTKIIERANEVYNK